MCKYENPNVLYSDVLKKFQIFDLEKQSNKTVFKCLAMFWQLPLLIKYGFLLDFDRNSDINCEKINNKSAIEYPEHVTAYIQEELDNKAMLGPFRTPPINNLHVSPFMTWDKSSSVNRRVIIDLIWPLGHYVNSWVGSDCYLGTEFVLSYPTIDNITNNVLKLGKGCEIFKIDISRVFRHVPIDPGDLDLLGLYWEDYVLNQSLLCGRGSIPVMAVSGKVGSCLPLVSSLQYRTLVNYMYWFPLPS